MTERRRKINDFIQARSEASLSELRVLVPGVSEMTIRRDLEALEREGRIVRVHGGARSIKSLGNLVEDVFSKRSTINIERKQKIGEKAAALIEEGSSIYLDSGSTLMEVAKRIPDVRLLITTNGLNVALELLHLEHVTVDLLGGEVSRGSISLFGPQAQEGILRLNIDAAFIAATAFSEEAGFTCGSVHDRALKNQVLAKARRRIILMDSTKIGKTMPHTFAQCSEIDMVISDGEMPESALAYFAARNVRVL